MKKVVAWNVGILIVLMLAVSVGRAAIPPGGVIGDNAITIIYDPANGGLRLDAAGKELTTLEILSAGKYFTGTKPPQVNGLFDVFSTNPADPKYGEKLFVLKPGASRFGDTDFGPAMAPGLSCTQIAADLTVSGALYPSGGLGRVDYIFCPEPSSGLLIGLSLLALGPAAHDERSVSAMCSA